MMEWFWTRSMVVIVYMKNDFRRFKMFDANRIEQIRENNDVTDSISVVL